MKYIRTKDGVYEVNEVIVRNRKMYELSNVDNLIRKESLKEIIIAQADTIEELCDELVVKHINNDKPYIADGYQKTKILKDRQKVFEYGVEIIYGAIWTSKGLIYVAKMDSEGKLVLI